MKRSKIIFYATLIFLIILNLLTASIGNSWQKGWPLSFVFGFYGDSAFDMIYSNLVLDVVFFFLCAIDLAFLLSLYDENSRKRFQFGVLTLLLMSVSGAVLLGLNVRSLKVTQIESFGTGIEVGFPKEFYRKFSPSGTDWPPNSERLSWDFLNLLTDVIVFIVIVVLPISVGWLINKKISKGNSS